MNLLQKRRCLFWTTPLVAIAIVGAIRQGGFYYGVLASFIPLWIGVALSLIKSELSTTSSGFDFLVIRSDDKLLLRRDDTWAGLMVPWYHKGDFHGMLAIAERFELSVKLLNRSKKTSFKWHEIRCECIEISIDREHYLRLDAIPGVVWRYEDFCLNEEYSDHAPIVKVLLSAINPARIASSPEDLPSLRVAPGVQESERLGLQIRS